jgi:hypothetical protein
MKAVLRIATILTWINMLAWGYIVASLLIDGISSQVSFFFVTAFFASFVVLHSYAALRLQRSIRNPAIPLSGQTPGGIRFIGMVVLLYGLFFLATGCTFLQQPREALQMFRNQMAAEMTKGLTAREVRAGGAIILLAGISITLNVFLNFRLLRWYFLSKRGDE